MRPPLSLHLERSGRSESRGLRRFRRRSCEKLRGRLFRDGARGVRIYSCSYSTTRGQKHFAFPFNPETSCTGRKKYGGTFPDLHLSIRPEAAIREEDPPGTAGDYGGHHGIRPDMEFGERSNAHKLTREGRAQNRRVEIEIVGSRKQ